MSDYNFSSPLICKIKIKISQIINKNNVKTKCNIRDEFHFSEVNGSINTMGPMQN